MTGKLSAFVLGICAVLLLPALPAIPASALLVLVLCALYFCKHPVLFLMLGCAWALWRIEWVLEHELPRSLEGHTLVLQGHVASLPEYSTERLRFVFRPDADSDFTGRILLSWYDEEPPRLVPGELWRFHVRLKRPHGMANSGGFDYEAWLLQRRIHATGYVLPQLDNRRLSPAAGYLVDRLRLKLLERLEKSLEGRPRAALVYALSLGERGRMEASEWQVLRRTGTTHLLAISGLHISMVALLAAGLARLLWRFWPGPRPAAPRFALYAALLPACFYALLAGFTLPTQRAVVMLVVVYIAALAGRRVPASFTLVCALTAVLVRDPLAPLSAGFWFSFGTVAMLILGMSGRSTRGAGIWWQWGRAQYLASLILLPLVAVWFRQYPLSGLLCNLLAVPWVGFCTLPLILSGLSLLLIWPTGGDMVLAGAAYSLEVLWEFLMLPAQWDAVLLELPEPPLVAVLIGTFCVLLLALPQGAVPRLPIFVGLLPLLIPEVKFPVHGDLHLTLLDVGQGLSVVVRTRRHVLVYDTGARLSPRLTAAEAALLPYLHSLGIRRLDGAVVSHADDDHAGGLRALDAHYPGTPIWSGEADKLLDIVDARDCHAGQGWNWDGVRFEFLHPAAAPVAGESANNRSCVLRVAAHGRTVLLTADIEQEAEQRMLRHQGRRLDAGVMLVPHHGSRTSSSATFLHATSPDFALLSVGYRNRFGFPKADIMERYTRLGSRIVSTADVGMIEVRLRRSAVDITEFRRFGGWWRRIRPKEVLNH